MTTIMRHVSNAGRELGDDDIASPCPGLLVRSNGRGDLDLD
jgi:hypothetical protein